MEKPVCGKCEGALKFRRWSDRKPAKSEALAVCTVCGELWQIRYFCGRQCSEPYQVKQKARKIKRGSYRAEESREAAIVAMWGSVQYFIDHAPLVCMSLQDKS